MMPTGPIYGDTPFSEALINATRDCRGFSIIGPDGNPYAGEIAAQPEQVLDLCNRLFWASLGVEEGRPIRGVVCVCAPDVCVGATKLAVPVSLERRSSLTDLLTASPQVPLGIRFTGSEPEAWGFVDPMHDDALLVRISGSGTIIVSALGEVRALFHKGEGFAVPAQRGVRWSSLVASVNKGASPTTFVARIRAIIAAMHEHRHGGMLLIVSSAEFAAHNEPTSLAFNYRCESTARVNEVHMTLRDVGLLSALDGALVIDRDTRVIGFGAKLKVDDSLTTIEESDLTKTIRPADVTVRDLGGTRHQSAARFVFQHRDCVAFVCSQDGRLTCFSWFEGHQKLRATRGIEHFIWESYP